MSYGLLWIETLVTYLLWVGLLAACAERSGRTVVRVLNGMLIFLALGLLAMPLVGAIALKFLVGLTHNWFVYTLTLFILAVVGTVMVSRRAGRAAPGLTATAAQWPRGPLTLTFCGALALWLMTFWNMDLAVQTQMATVQVEAGSLMLAVAPPPIDDAQNAALIYEKAFARLDADKTLAEDTSPLKQDKPDMPSPATASLLDRHARTLALLHQAAALPACRFDHDFAHPSFEMLLPELSKARSAGRLLRLAARSELAQGRVDNALDAIRDLLHLSRHMTGTPTLINMLVAISIETMARDTLAEVLPAVTRPAQLSAVDLGDAGYMQRNLRRSLEGEEAAALAMLSGIGTGRYTFGELTAMADGSTVLNGTRDRPLAALFRVFLLPDEIQNYRHYMADTRKAALEPYFKVQASLHETENTITHMGLLMRLLAPSLNGCFKQVAKSSAQHSTAQVAMALTAYRLDHGQYPGKLDLLVPAYLDEVPLDPFDGKPLRLIAKPDELVIYSVGPDGKDDGGTPIDHHNGKETGDLPFGLKMKTDGGK